MSYYSDLPAFNDRYLQFFDPIQKSFQLRRKSRANGNLGITECMELVSAYLKRYQMSYIPHKLDPKLVMFPFMFIEPTEGDKIVNLVTRETYTVEQVIKDPETGVWAGVVKLNLVTPPSVEKRHHLEYLNFDKYVRFDHELPTALPNNTTANLEGDAKILPPMVPTVTWSLDTVEPGSMDRPFGSNKQYKKTLREAVKDPLVPGYTVEIYGQPFDNLVQFSSWSHDHRTSEKLISWFEQFLKYYTSDLRQGGIAQLFFWKREPDSINTTWRQYYAVRSSQWYFRTEELEAVYQRDILKIDINIGLYTGGGVIPHYRNNTPRYIADQYVSGTLSPDQYRALFYRSGEHLFGELDILQ